MYSANASYGNAIVLAAYAGLPEPEFPPTIPGYLQPWLGLEMPPATAHEGAPTFIWGRAARMRLHRAGRSNYTLIGAPWLYLLELEKQDRIPLLVTGSDIVPQPPKPGRLLYFPYHGLSGTLAAVRRARALEGEAQVTVALTHQQAASPETVAAYTGAGAHVVDLGAALDPVGTLEPFYLHRLLELMRAHRIIRCDAADAFAAFAHSAGLPVTGEFDTASMPNLVKKELGTDCVLPPQELRAIFDWSTHV